jgi:hypothetical protein
MPEFRCRPGDSDQSGRLRSKPSLPGHSQVLAAIDASRLSRRPDAGTTRPIGQRGESSEVLAGVRIKEQPLLALPVRQR